MAKATQKRKSFKEAVEATHDVAECWQPGLRALGNYSSRISVSSMQQLGGSVDIDGCTSKKYPQGNRWDYAFGYRGEAFFVEVHSANSSEVKVVLRKLQWLKDWLNSKALEINNLKTKTLPPFYWIQSGKFSIPKGSPQYRAAKSAGLMPIGKLNLT